MNGKHKQSDGDCVEFGAHGRTFRKRGLFGSFSTLLTIGDNGTTNFRTHTKNDSRKREQGEGISYMTMVLHFQQQQNDNRGFRVF